MSHFSFTKININTTGINCKIKIRNLFLAITVYMIKEYETRYEHDHAGRS